MSSAQNTAAEDFNLHSRKRVLEFIRDGGLEEPTYCGDGPKEWENNPDKTTTIWVDAYDFYSGKAYGYIAFLKFQTGRWGIKSLKRNLKGGSKGFNSQLAEALARFRLGGEE